MKIYILGICGTFMAGIAMLAREKGIQVSGSDASVYPPMSTQLEQAGIEVHEGYTTQNLNRSADVFIVGNAISRGNEQLEAILNEGLSYVSGPEWLYKNILHDRWVLAVAGTHGKTTTSGMLAWILDYAGLQPGFLIGGLTRNFNTSARLGNDPFFVIEADEYDTAFCDKRSKFVHYHPRTLVLNNLEFDHADIFEDLKAIKKQFHHLLRIVPANGQVIYNQQDDNLHEVLGMGCWSERRSFGIEQADLILQPENDHVVEQHMGRAFTPGTAQTGTFNQLNACAALLAAQHAGVPLESGLQAMQQFEGVKRRQEVLAEINGISIIDDFAHHPTAICMTLEALRPKTRGKLIAVVEPRSNSMKMGIHAESLVQAFNAADKIVLYDNAQLKWDIHAMTKAQPERFSVYNDIDQMIQHLLKTATRGDRIIIMSNGGFGGLHQKLIQALKTP